MKDQDSLKDSYKNIIAAIKALRKEINTILDQLEAQTVQQLDNLMEDLELSVKDDLDTCAHMNDQLTTMVDKVEQITGKHKETNSYIGFRKWQIKSNEVTGRVQEIQRRPKEMMSFNFDKSVLRFLRNLNNLGYVERSHSTSKTTDTVDVYQAVSQMQYSVKIKSDKTDCHIVGICELPSGEVVIADCKSERVKLLNQQYKVIGHYNIHDPQGVCYIADSLVAIAGVDVYEYYLEVYFLTVDSGQLNIVRKIATGYHCRTIAHREGQLYLCSNSRLDQCTMDGEIKNKIYEYKFAGLNIYKCDVTPDGERIYVLDNIEHKLVTLDKVGKVVSILKDPDLQEPTGLCVSPSGHVFVCCKGSDTVLQVDREGRKKLATVASSSDRLCGFSSVWFSEQTLSLIVGNCKGIIVIKLCKL